MYDIKLAAPRGIASAKGGFPKGHESGGRLLLRHGLVVDPFNDLEAVRDIAVSGGKISDVSQELIPERGDRVIECDGLLVVPGLIDMHLHIGDLFEVTTASSYCAAQDGVTTAFSPGAGNTFMAPALLGAEIDRGMPINAGVYLGGASVLGTMLDTQELVALFRGELPEETAARKLSRNPITNRTAPLVIGIKDHMGHFIMSDENIDRLFTVTSQAGLIYMSHTQDIEHTLRMVGLAKGRPLHLGHANAVGCSADGQAAENIRCVTELCRRPNITGEFVGTMLRPNRGCREGIRMDPLAQQAAFDALRDGSVKILVSDGQNQSTMKGFGDTRDNIPAILELAQEGVLSLSDAVATMTRNPAALIAERTGNAWWRENMGNLSPGSPADITVIDRGNKRAAYTLVGGRITAFEGRIIRTGLGAGSWMCKFGKFDSLGVGDLALFD